MINSASMTFVGAVAAGLMLGVWYSRSKPLHIARSQRVPLETAQKADEKARADKATAFEKSGERFYFVACWDKDTKLPIFYSNGHKTIEDARQAAAKFVRSLLGPAEIRDAKTSEPLEKIWLEGDRVLSAAL